jgi:hypothetical protein
MRQYKPTRQHLPLTQKTKKWHEDNLESIVGMSNWSYYYNKDKVNYDLVNGIINQEDFSYITKPYGVSPKATLPEDLQHFPIITSNIKALEGEFIKRPDNFRVYAVNPEAISEYLREKDDMLNQMMIQFIKQTRMELALQQNPELQNDPQKMQELEEQIITPEEIEERLLSFKDSYEVMGNEILRYLYNQLDLKHKFRTAFNHGIISAKEIYHIYKNNYEPALKVVNPLRFFCDMDNDSLFIHDGDWAFTIDYLTPGKVIEIYSDELTEDEQVRILEESRLGLKMREKGWQVFDSYPNLTSDVDDASQFGEQHTCQVIHCVWRSYYKVGFLTFIDEQGQEQITQVPETYKLNKELGDIEIKWEWWPEIRECTKINQDIYIRAGLVETVAKDPDNPFYAPLPYTGVIHNNLNSIPTSAVDLMKPYNYMYNIVKRMIQKDIASDKGKKLLANINQIPTSEGIDLDKWQHYLEIDDIVWVNPNEEGNRGADTASWRTVDMSSAQSLNYKVQYLEYLEQKCKAVIGLNDQRTGQVGNNELVGTTQMQIMQSLNITEPWYATHELGKKAALTMLLNASKFLFSQYPNKKLVYVASDRTKKLIELDQNKLSCASYGVFLSSATEDISKYNALKEYFQAAVNAQTIGLSTVAKAINGDFTPNQLVKQLEEGEARVQKMQQEAQERALQAQQEVAQAEQELERIKIELEKYKIDVDSSTKIRVAEIGAFRFQEDLDKNNDGIIDFMELEQEKEAAMRESSLKQSEQLLNSSLKRQELEMQRGLKEKELAMKREELKLKNKEIDTNLKIARENKNKYDK